MLGLYKCVEVRSNPKSNTMKKAGLEIQLSGNLDYSRTAKAMEAAMAAILSGKDSVKVNTKQFRPESDCSGPSWSHSEWVNELSGTVQVTALDRTELEQFLSEKHQSWCYPTSEEVVAQVGRCPSYGGGISVTIVE